MSDYSDWKDNQDPNWRPSPVQPSDTSLRNEIGAIVAQIAAPVKRISRASAIDQLTKLLADTINQVIGSDQPTAKSGGGVYAVRITGRNNLRAEQRSRLERLLYGG